MHGEGNFEQFFLRSEIRSEIYVLRMLLCKKDFIASLLEYRKKIGKQTLEREKHNSEKKTRVSSRVVRVNNIEKYVLDLLIP